MPTPYTPPGHAPPAEIVDSKHHGAWIIIATALGLILCVISLLIRYYVRATVGAISRASDILLIAAATSAAVQSALVFFEISEGFGKSVELVSLQKLDRVQKVVFASDVLYLITLHLSKCCVAFIYRHLTPYKNHKRASLAVMVLSTLWVITSIFMVAVNCELNQPWVDMAARCSNLFLRWQIITAFDIITEVCLFLVSVYIVAGLQMHLKAKAIVLTAFGLRLPVIAAAALRLHSLNGQVHSFNPTLHGVNTVLWTQIELYYSLIACTTYCWKPFMAAVSTRHGSVAIDVEQYDHTNGPSAKGYGHNSQLRSGSFAVSSLHKPEEPDEIRSTREKQAQVRTETLFPPIPTSHWTTIRGGRRGNRDIGSAGSGGSKQMMIKKQVEYEVEYSQDIQREEKPQGQTNEVSLKEILQESSRNR